MRPDPARRWEVEIISNYSLSSIILFNNTYVIDFKNKNILAHLVDASKRSSRLIGIANVKWDILFCFYNSSRLIKEVSYLKVKTIKCRSQYVCIGLLVKD